MLDSVSIAVLFSSLWNHGGGGMLFSCRWIRDGSIEVPSTSSPPLSFLKNLKKKKQSFSIVVASNQAPFWQWR